MFELFRRRLNAAKQAGADVIEINEEYLLAGAAALLDRCWIEDRLSTRSILEQLAKVPDDPPPRRSPQFC